MFSQPKQSEKKSPVVESKAPSTRLSILHVEDHKLAARIVEEILTAQGFQVERYASGLAAFEVLKTDADYDVLIVDNRLPRLSGLELVLRVRTMPHRRNLPIIMLSEDDVEKEAWRAGVDAFLYKAEAANQLPTTISRVLGERDQ